MCLILYDKNELNLHCNEEAMNWIEIKETNMIDKIRMESLSEPDRNFIIFKHSTRCGTSRMAKNNFESDWTLSDAVHLVNVVENREVSNRIAAEFHVHHESPQVLIIRNGVSIYDNSHSSIDAPEIIKMIQSKPA